MMLVEPVATESGAYLVSVDDGRRWYRVRTKRGRTDPPGAKVYDEAYILGRIAELKTMERSLSIKIHLTRDEATDLIA